MDWAPEFKDLVRILSNIKNGQLVVEMKHGLPLKVVEVKEIQHDMNLTDLVKYFQEIDHGQVMIDVHEKTPVKVQRVLLSHMIKKPGKADEVDHPPER